MVHHSNLRGRFMHIDHLKIFCDLAESQSFSKAAAMHSISQSAVSQQVRTLEKKLSVTLIDRSRRSFSLTPEGHSLVEAAREMLAIYDDLSTRLQTARNVVHGELRVATIFSIGLHELPERLKAFREKHPDVRVKVEFRRSQQVYQEVMDGEVDLGLVAYPVRRTGLNFHVFQEDEMVLIVPPSHPLAERKSVSVRALTDENFISFEPDLPTRKMIDRHLRAHQVNPTHVMEFDNIETVKRAVEVESGISIVPQNTVKQEISSGVLKAVHLEGEKLCRPLGAIYRRNRSCSLAQSEFLAALSAPNV